MYLHVTFSPCLTNNSSTVGNVLPFIFSLNSIHNASWFLDSGATDHVSSSLAYFTSYSLIKPIIVHLPNGQEVLATHLGLVKFSKTLFLYDVLYTPSFTFNLISISKLVSSLNCILTFSSTKCLIEDMNTKMMIGTIDVVASLYKLVVSPPSLVNTIFANHTSVCTIVIQLSCNKLPIDLWHFRLGHISHDHMLLMKDSYPSLVSDKNFICNTCHNAKQRRLLFSKSDSHASQPLALLHVDIWGLCAKISFQGHQYFLL
uniref:Copia protein n=1 Tax=Cajanus cajan TaxID=3821 RepID=A0A151UBU1_CAJCA|nr:Copia protein [Cajanus cajan]